MTLLKNFKVIDLSLRLPGPLAGKILTDLGATVVKIEDAVFKDPFLNGLFNQQDDHFINWYDQLNSKKEIVRFDFKSDESQKLLGAHLKNTDALILAQPQKIKDLLGIDKNTLHNDYPNLTVVELKAGNGKFKNLHDLNALALAGLLDMHVDTSDKDIIYPPFLPISGISFGHWIVTKLLAAKISRDRWIEASLEEATENILLPFKSSGKGRPSYLHNGKFPCYCLYRTSDDKILAIAAVEDKFWKRFVELFELDLSMDQRFDTTFKTFQIISERIKKIDSHKISQILRNEDICICLLVS